MELSIQGEEPYMTKIFKKTVSRLIQHSLQERSEEEQSSPGASSRYWKVGS
jgi:hypothetical protein